ncbi:MAG: hypothetical protein JO235_11280 [Chroococcidiopsidaceae cyanobacterium CP_BM_RX_35]|nr:hypothetical protein [Chroococcidiopsidaceae cyanobacterium CP_BM_RX_35]
MLDFIKNLFNGILSFFAGLFSGFTRLTSGLKSQKDQPDQAAIKPASNGKKRKSKGYFMELDEETEVQPFDGSQVISNPVAAAKSAAKELAKAAEPVAAKVTAATKELAKTAEPVAAKVTATKEPAKEPAKSGEPATAKVTATKEPAKTQESATAKSGKVKLKPEEVELVQTAEGVRAEPAKPATPISPNGQSHTETTFAPKYLIPSNSSNSRRRPGPNMNPFLDMARQVNTRS